MKQETFLKVAAIVTAATVGDGVFALPFVFYKAGWLLGLCYLAILGAMVVLAHTVYYETLQKTGEKERLLGLARKYLGEGGFWTGFVAIVFGLLLTLVAYLILGTQFIRLGFPSAPPQEPLFFFWAFVAVTMLLNDKHVIELELTGIIFTSLVIILIFVTAWPNVVFNGVSAVNPVNFFVPFGAILFSLAGWTAIEPAYESEKSRGNRSAKRMWIALAAGTSFAALLYVMFAAGILGTAGTITPDTISGLANWPIWKRDVTAVLGLLAVWTVSMPISREIRNSLERDLGWSKFASRATIVFAPLVLVLLGLTNFLVVVGLVGGLFLSTQYLLIVSVGRRALTLSATRKFFLDLVAVIFIVAAIYSVWIFVVH